MPSFSLASNISKICCRISKGASSHGKDFAGPTAVDGVSISLML
jgi:hypothetical protein